MNQSLPPDVEIPTLNQTLPPHWRTRPLEIPWITERAPVSSPPTAHASHHSVGPGPLESSSGNDPASLAPEPLARPDVPGLTEPAGPAESDRRRSPESDLARLVNTVIQATGGASPAGQSTGEGLPDDALAHQVVERVQARLAHLLPDLVQEAMEELQPNTSTTASLPDRGKPSDEQEMK